MQAGPTSSLGLKEFRHKKNDKPSQSFTIPKKYQYLIQFFDARCVNTSTPPLIDADFSSFITQSRTLISCDHEKH